MKLIGISGSLFSLGMVPHEKAGNMSLTEMDISQGANVVFKRQFIRQLQFDNHLKSDEIYRLLRSISLTNIYHRYFKYIL